MFVSALNILYIEDNLGDRFILQESLANTYNTHELHFCDKLQEGFDLIDKKEFDLILLDLSLPDSRGVESVKLLNEKVRSAIPIIVFTGLNDNDIAMRSLNFGAQDFLVKGDFDLMMLNKTIRYAIERHKVQHELVLKSNMLNRAESMADIGSWEMDLKRNRVKLSNGMKRLLHLEPNSDLVSIKEFLTFIHQQDKSSILSMLTGKGKQKISTSIELRFVRTNGEVVHSLCKVVFASKAGSSQLVHGVTLDVSNQKEVEKVKEAFTLELSNKVKERTQELENTKRKLEKSLSKEKELGELKSRFVSTASHQFRTPLTVIQSNVGLLEMQIGPNEREAMPFFDKVTGRIKSEVKRMTEIMDEVLILGKINSGGIHPVFNRTDVLAICTDIVDKYNEIQDDDRTAVIHVEGENRMVDLDKSLFEDALSNMLSNAFKYSVGKPSPEVRLIFGRKKLDIEVKDFGMGIPEHDLKNLFAPFFRASNVLDVPGNGLGTSIMKEYIELNKGKIIVESAMNKGTLVKVQFKLSKDD